MINFWILILFLYCIEYNYYNTNIVKPILTSIIESGYYKNFSKHSYNLLLKLYIKDLYFIIPMFNFKILKGILILYINIYKPVLWNINFSEI